MIRQHHRLAFFLFLIPVWTEVASGSGIASFDFRPSGPLPGDVVVFSPDCPAGTFAYAWEFEDGKLGDSTAKNPEVRFTSAGLYKVSLVCKSSTGSEPVEGPVRVCDFSFGRRDPLEFESKGGSTSLEVLAEPPSGCRWRIGREEAGPFVETLPGEGLGNAKVEVSAPRNSGATRVEIITLRSASDDTRRIESVRVLGSRLYDPFSRRLEEMKNASRRSLTVVQAGAQGTITIELDTRPNDSRDFDFNGDLGPLGRFALDDDDDPTLRRSRKFPVDPGTYSVTQAPVDGWLLDGIKCDDPTGDTTASGRTATIELDPNETVACTFLNSKREQGVIEIVKVALPRSAQDFEFIGDGGIGRFNLDDDEDPVLSNKKRFAVDPGTYSVTEQAVDGWVLEEIDCGDPTGNTVVAGRTATIEVGSGETVTCTYFNNGKGRQGTIEIVKIALPSGPQDFEFIGDGGIGRFTLDDDEDPVLSDRKRFVLDPDGYRVTEELLDGWTLDDVRCNDPTDDSTTAGNTATIELGPGETVTCTFSNVAVPRGDCVAEVVHSMAAWWPFDERAGPITADIARSNDGWQLHGPEAVAGKVGRALSFDGVDDYIYVADDPSIDLKNAPGGGFSITFWIKTEAGTNRNMVILEKLSARNGSGGPSTRGYQLFVSDGLLGLRLNDVSFMSDTFVADGNWHFVAVTVDRGNPNGGRWYLDGHQHGVEFDPTPQGGSLANSAALLIGRRGFDREGDPGGHFNGTLDELQIFSRVLSREEVLDIRVADDSGQCKETVHVTSVTPVCAGALDGRAHLTICNHSTAPNRYRLEPRGLSADDCGDVDGPTDFRPDSERVDVEPRTCKTVEVSIGRPAGMTADGLEACYEVDVRNLSSGSTFTRGASLWARTWCAAPAGEIPIILTEGKKGEVGFEVTAGDGPATLQYGIEAEATGLSLGGRASGQAVTGEVTVGDGEAETVSTMAQIQRHQPFEFHDIRLLESTTSAPLASTAVVSAAPGLLLNDRRFRVEVEWRDFEERTGVGHAVPFRSEDSGILWFFSADNWEMLVKVLDGCGANDHFWVFAAATTNVEYTLRVTDTESGASKTYINPLGNASPAITDTEALAVCSKDAAATDSRVRLELDAPLSPDSESPTVLTRKGRVGDCTPSAASLCLSDGRFQVEGDWTDFEGGAGVARAVPFGSDDSGLLWFFGSDNWEVLVKVLDGCRINDRFWVFAAATTNVEYTLRVTDTETGTVKEYLNRLGDAAVAITDTSAFETCPDP